VRSEKSEPAGRNPNALPPFATHIQTSSQSVLFDLAGVELPSVVLILPEVIPFPGKIYGVHDSIRMFPALLASEPCNHHRDLMCRKVLLQGILQDFEIVRREGKFWKDKHMDPIYLLVSLF